MKTDVRMIKNSGLHPGICDEVRWLRVMVTVLQSREMCGTVGKCGAEAMVFESW